MCRVGRLSRWVDEEDIMSDGADKVGIKKWDGKSFGLGHGVLSILNTFIV